MSHKSPPPAELALLSSLQGRVLSHLFASRVRKTVRDGIDRLVLKGGLALRLTHDHLRHTGDIDLDADKEHLSLPFLRKLVGRAIEDAVAQGGLEETTITEAKMTDTVARWKVGWRMADSEQRMVMKVEISMRQPIISPADLVHATAKPDSTMIPVYHQEELLLSKAHALVNRQEEALRDAADLYLLFESGVMPTPEQVLERWTREEVEELAKACCTQADGSPCDGPIAQTLDGFALDQTRFADQILGYWDPARAPMPEEWLDMCQFVKERLGAMWRAALENQPAEPAQPPVRFGVDPHGHH